MSTAPSGPDHGYEEPFDDPAEGPVEAGDLLDDPRTDVEALCLCSLLWSSSPVARTITDTLTPSDFERPVYRDLFELIAAQIEAGTPHDPASVAAALTQTGRAAGALNSAVPSPMPPWPEVPPKRPGTTRSLWSAPPTGAASTLPRPR